MVDRANCGGVMFKIYIPLLRIKLVVTSRGGPARMLRRGFSYVEDSRAPACPSLMTREME